jgi:hypothetical protein
MVESAALARSDGGSGLSFGKVTGCHWATQELSACASPENQVLGASAALLMEATMLTTARFPGSIRDI